MTYLGPAATSSLRPAAEAHPGAFGGTRRGGRRRGLAGTGAPEGAAVGSPADRIRRKDIPRASEKSVRVVFICYARFGERERLQVTLTQQDLVT